MTLLSERRFITFDNVTSGMLVEFSYTKKDNTTNSYTVLVIDPSYAGTAGVVPKLHAINLDNMIDEEIIRLASNFRQNINIDPDLRRDALVEELDTDVAYDSFRKSQFFAERKYRTFNIDKIFKLRQILIGSLAN